jgi:hypothetical protein
MLTDRAPPVPDKRLQRRPGIRYTADMGAGFPMARAPRTTQCTEVPENGARAQPVKPRNSVIVIVRPLGPLNQSVDSGSDRRYNGALETSDGN